MIQRIQTIWLFLAALISALLLLDWYTGYVFHADVAAGFTVSVQHLKVSAHFPSLILAVIMVLLPLIAIFLYKDRKRQKMLVWISLLAAVAFIGVNLMRIENFKNDTAPLPVNGSYDAGSVLPVVVVVFLILAMRGINKDEKLIKSLDRLR
jgi:glucan phosphoethanolaminetransferase (alkaline phosphatase superfamily)